MRTIKNLSLHLWLPAVLACCLPGALLADTGTCLEPQAHIPWGPTRAVEGNTSSLAVANGAGVIFYDVTDPSQPTELHRLNLGAPIWRMSLEGNRLLAAERMTESMHILDISDPSAPVQQGVWRDPGRAPFAITSEGNLAFIAAVPFGLQVLDLADPGDPQLIGELRIEHLNFAWDIQQANDRVYFSADHLGVYIIDVSDPTMPVQVGHYQASGSVRGVEIDGDHLFVGVLGSGIHVLDVSDPQQIGELEVLTVSGNMNRLQRVGSQLYASSSDGLAIIDLSVPGSPGYGSLDSAQNDFRVRGQRIYTIQTGGLTSGLPTSGLRVWDSQAPGAPALSAEVTIDDAYTDAVTLLGDVAVTAARQAGLIAYDISEPAVLTELSRIRPERTPGRLASRDAIVYVAGSSRVQLIDYTDPSSPQQLPSIEFGGNASADVAVLGDRLYVSRISDGYAIVDISTPASPVVLQILHPDPDGESPTPGTSPLITRLGFAGQRGVAMSGQGQFWALDASNPSAPIPGSLLDLGATPKAIAIAGDYAYVALGASGLAVVDIADIQQPELLTIWQPFPTTIEDVKAEGSQVWVAAGTLWGVFRLDTTTPGDPVIADWFNTSGESRGVATDGERVLVADWDAGLWLLACDDVERIFADGFEATTQAQ